ncbi:hypothetical protein HF324_27790 [Chitinophaga oryzae]|uniref:Uncharacterized protein n=1 Tax=Chitinophaga oryzae TaxID=2725414 RepID=A0AAE6ZMM5_9BACT|nr:hypothetical protein [Chitinophaga oryzae]QJB34928.1 hypothetical protein HF329_27930 [Chitinophaga oryzae]QJB41439.1 hypothetical protein HF324_27790 [Chitinophaga oryzae]
MNFSNEELYAMYGQYDTNILITFKYGSNAFKIFGATLMGTIVYTQQERDALEISLKENPIPRTDKKIRILPSHAMEVTQLQFEQAERYGILCSEIIEVSSYNWPRTNRFTEKNKKEISITHNVAINARRDQLNRLEYGFLEKRYSLGETLSPEEVNKFLGLRSHFGLDISQPPYKDLVHKSSEVRYFSLNAKMNALTINEEEMKEFAGIIVSRYNEREELIHEELKRSNLKLTEIAENYGDKLSNLKDICHGFSEEIILFGEKLVYLNLERFLHIYARHVTETQVGGQYEGKTVFQYKYEDIIRLIKAVIETEADAIQDHFKNNPTKEFIRMGKRAAYYDGHYYRIQILPSGLLDSFHPYNNNEEKDNDN